MAERLRSALGRPASGALVLMMLVGCLLLWIGVPVGWLWIGSQVQSSVSLGTALLITMAGIIATVLPVVGGLAWLNRRHAALQRRRSQIVAAHSALEVIFVTSAGIAVVVFSVWFFGFAGASPLPLNIGF